MKRRGGCLLAVVAICIMALLQQGQPVSAAAQSFEGFKIGLSTRDDGDGNSYVKIDWSEYDYKNKNYITYVKTEGGSWTSTGVDYTLVKEVKILNVCVPKGTAISHPTENRTMQFKYSDAFRGIYAPNINQWLKTAGRDVVFTVNTAAYTDFNRNPDAYLKKNGSYQYDVVYFGSNDYGFDLSKTGKEAVEAYLKTGRGVLTGHDCVQFAYHPNWAKLAKYFGITDAGTEYAYKDGNTRTNKVEIVQEGLLVNYPFDIGETGTILTVPFTHMNGQKNSAKIWMQLVDSEDAAEGEKSNCTIAKPFRGTVYNAYLTSTYNCASFQAGNMDEKMTADEQKILANTLFYLNQLNFNNYNYDRAAKDKKSPDKPKIVMSADQKNANITLKDYGTAYWYKVEAYEKDSARVGVYGKDAGYLGTSETKKITVTTGVKGYVYVIDDSENTKITKTSQGKAVSSSSGLTEASLNVSGKEGKWLHVACYDYAGNWSETESMKLAQAYTVTLEAENGVAKTSLKGYISGEGNRYTCAQGSKITVKAAADTGYHDVKWSGYQQSKEASFSFTMPGKNITLTASAVQNSYTIHFDGNGASTGKMDDLKVVYNQTVTLPENRYVRETENGTSQFAGWGMDGNGIHREYENKAQVRNLTEEPDAVITLYAIWDDCPQITAYNLYYTLQQAQNGYITLEELMSHAAAKDREDGENIVFEIRDYLPADFTGWNKSAVVSETFRAIDSSGNETEKMIYVYLTDTTPVDVAAPKTTRFISEKYYGMPYEQGGLASDSVWLTDAEYRQSIEQAFENLRNDTPLYVFDISKNKAAE